MAGGALFLIAFLLVFIYDPREVSTLRVILISANTSHNPIYHQTHQFTVNNGVLDVIINIRKNYPRDIWAEFVVGMWHPKHKSYRTMLQYDANICQLIGKHESRFLDQFINFLFKHSDLPRSCPILKVRFIKVRYFCNNTFGFTL